MNNLYTQQIPKVYLEGYLAKVYIDENLLWGRDFIRDEDFVFYYVTKVRIGKYVYE